MSLYINFSEAINLLETTEPVEMLWNGVVKNSFGLVFGPSKSGKTIFCENLAISFALGKDEFMGYPINSEPKKVMFIGLEEYWVNRIDRNKKQFDFLSDDEKKLFKNNFLIPKIDFPKTITTRENWALLRETIKSSGAEIVFIDSVTRMNHNKLEDSKTAEQICLNLRNISQDLNITLFVIHHTPKLGDDGISMDKIKGSSSFSQESDFAIAVGRNERKVRYIKNIYFRYADDSDDSLHEFTFNENLIVEPKGIINSFELSREQDRRTSTNRQAIVDFIDSNSSVVYATNELVSILKEKLNIQERQIKSYLSDLVNTEKIVSPRQGIYTSKLNTDVIGGTNE